MQHEIEKPDNIRYWVNDRPPWSVTLIASVQQVALLGSIMTISVLLGQTFGLDDVGRSNLVTITMICAGVGVMLQALNRHGIGSGLFLPVHTSAAAFPAMSLAAQFGGLGLAFGMLSVVGAVQLLLSRFILKLRRLFPVEIAGLAVLIIGMEVGHIGIQNIFGIGLESAGEWTHQVLGLATLGLIIAITVWCPPIIKPFAVIAGLISGQSVAFALGLVDDHFLELIFNAKPFAIPPLTYFGWSFDWRLIPNFAVVGVALSCNCFAITVIAQQSVDSGWDRADMEGIKRSLASEGLTNCLASLFNGVTQTASGPAVGLAQSSGIVSRMVSFAAGGMLVLLSFFPIVPAVWTSLLPAVLGATLAFVGAFIVLTGIQILTLPLLDSRRRITLGVAIICGIGSETISHALGGGPTMIHPIASTPLTTSMTVAIFLNAAFLIRNRKTRQQVVELTGDWSDEVADRIWNLARSWGTRPEIARRLETVANEVIDVVAHHDLLEGDRQVFLAAKFDDLGCTLTISYLGKGFALAEQPPDPEEMLENPDAVRDLAGYIIRNLADQAVITVRDRMIDVHLVFDA